MATFQKDGATINDVAARAGVSKTTVSRYLNKKFEFMSDETRAKIARVIEEMDYRPSTIARSLKSNKSGTIGCIIADITSHFSSILVKGVNDVAQKHGYQVLFVNVDNDPKKEREGIRSLLHSQVDGLVINTTGFNDDYIIELFSRGLPVALADRCLRDRFAVDTVTTENYHTTFECIRHLHTQGYRHVAFFTEDIGKNSSRYIRHAAYITAMEQLYRADGNAYTYRIDANDISVCKRHIYSFMEKCAGEPGAIFTVNGVTLLNVLNGIFQAGYSLSPSLGLCGFDDWGWASVVPPGITTVTQDSYKVGVLSAEMVFRRMRAQKKSRPRFVELPNKLYIRGSTQRGQSV